MMTAPSVVLLLLQQAAAAYYAPRAVPCASYRSAVTPLAAARALLRTNVPSGIDDSYNGYEYDARPRAERNAPALNALWDEYLWQLLRAWISVRGPQVGTSARHAVASTPELSRQVVAFLVGDPSIHA